MPKVLDPNHLALMTAVRKAVEDLRRVHQSLAYEHEDNVPPTAKDLHELTAVMDRLRLTLKGRAG